MTVSTHTCTYRERAVQELRRHGLAPPGDSAGRLSMTSPLARSASPSRYIHLLNGPDRRL